MHGIPWYRKWHPVPLLALLVVMLACALWGMYGYFYGSTPRPGAPRVVLSSR